MRSNPSDIADRRKRRLARLASLVTRLIDKDLPEMTSQLLDAHLGELGDHHEALLIDRALRIASRSCLILSLFGRGAIAARLTMERIGELSPESELIGQLMINDSALFHHLSDIATRVPPLATPIRSEQHEIDNIDHDTA